MINIIAAISCTSDEINNTISLFALVISTIFSLYTIIANKKTQRDVRDYQFKMAINSKMFYAFYKQLAKQIMIIKENKNNNKNNYSNLNKTINECKNSMAHLGIENEELYANIKKKLIAIDDCMMLIIIGKNIDENKSDMIVCLKEIYMMFNKYYAFETKKRKLK